jgi:hypothetical protein
VAHYLVQVGERTDLTVIASGWDWPGDELEPRVAGHLARGGAVYINVSPESWHRSLRPTSEWPAVERLLESHGHAAPDAAGMARLGR